MPKDKYINEDTYQTLESLKIEPQSDFEKATKPLWKKDTEIVTGKQPRTQASKKSSKCQVC